MAARAAAADRAAAVAAGGPTLTWQSMDAHGRPPSEDMPGGGGIALGSDGRGGRREQESYAEALRRQTEEKQRREAAARQQSREAAAHGAGIEFGGSDYDRQRMAARAAAADRAAAVAAAQQGFEVSPSHASRAFNGEAEYAASPPAGETFEEQQKREKKEKQRAAADAMRQQLEAQRQRKAAEQRAEAEAERIENERIERERKELEARYAAELEREAADRKARQDAAGDVMVKAPPPKKAPAQAAASNSQSPAPLPWAAEDQATQPAAPAASLPWLASAGSEPDHADVAQHVTREEQSLPFRSTAASSAGPWGQASGERRAPLQAVPAHGSGLSLAPSAVHHMHIQPGHGGRPPRPEVVQHTAPAAAAVPQPAADYHVLATQPTANIAPEAAIAPTSQMDMFTAHLQAAMRSGQAEQPPALQVPTSPIQSPAKEPSWFTQSLKADSALLPASAGASPVAPGNEHLATARRQWLPAPSSSRSLAGDSSLRTRAGQSSAAAKSPGLDDRSIMGSSRFMAHERSKLEFDGCLSEESGDDAVPAPSSSSTCYSLGSETLDKTLRLESIPKLSGSSHSSAPSRGSHRRGSSEEASAPKGAGLAPALGSHSGASRPSVSPSSAAMDALWPAAEERSPRDQGTSPMPDDPDWLDDYLAAQRRGTQRAIDSEDSESDAASLYATMNPTGARADGVVRSGRRARSSSSASADSSSTAQSVAQARTLAEEQLLLFSGPAQGSHVDTVQRAVATIRDAVQKTNSTQLKTLLNRTYAGPVETIPEEDEGSLLSGRLSDGVAGATARVSTPDTLLPSPVGAPGPAASGSQALVVPTGQPGMSMPMMTMGMPMSFAMPMPMYMQPAMPGMMPGFGMQYTSAPFPHTVNSNAQGPAPAPAYTVPQSKPQHTSAAPNARSSQRRVPAPMQATSPVLHARSVRKAPESALTDRSIAGHTQWVNP